MGNALDAAKFSVEQGNTGVGTKKTLLEGIDKAQLGVKTWKENIDKERLKLKTDTAKKYREAENDVMKNLPSDKTSRDLALNALSEYKDRLYGNMGLVQSGLISADDNLIFQENGKQSFNILAQQINDYSKQKEQAIKEASGYYELNEDGSKKLGKDGLPIYVEPTAGGVQAALQDFHDRMGNPDFTQIGFGENGMGKVTFLKTKIDKTTNTRVLDLDSDGKPQTYGGLKEMSVLAFDQGKNQKSARFNLDKEVNGLVSGGLGGKYQELKRVGNMSGVIVDDQKNNPQFFQLLETAVDTAVVTTERVASVLSDNGLEAERSQVINDIQAKELEADGIDLDEKINYTYLDMETGKMVTGQKNKYIKMKMASNNTMVPAATPDDIIAARNVARTNIFGALDKTYIDKGVRDSQFAPPKPSAADNATNTLKKQKVGRVEFSKRLALGGEQADKALEEMNQSGLYTLEKGYNQILSKSKVKTVKIDGVERKAEVYRVQTPSGPKDTYVFHTTKNNKPIPLQERTRQTLAIMMTNPTETKDLFDTYISEGNNFDETYKESNFNQKDKVSSVNVRLSLDTTTGGTGQSKSTLGDEISLAAIAADEADSFGSDNNVLASGLQNSLQQALLNSGQTMESPPKVTANGTKIKIRAKNSDGKVITVTGNVDNGQGIDASTIETQAKALITEFLSNINSDKNYSTKRGKYELEEGEKLDFFGNVIK